MDLSEMTATKGLNIVVMEGTKSFDYKNCLEETYKTNAKCKFIDYTDKAYDDFATWLSNYSAIKKNISYKIIDEKSDDYNANKAGIIKSITIDNTPVTASSIFEIKDSKIVVTYYAKKVTKPEEQNNEENNNENTNSNQNNTTQENNNESNNEGNETNGGN